MEAHSSTKRYHRATRCLAATPKPAPSLGAGPLMLNTLWLGFFLTAAVAALAQWLVGGNADIFSAMVQALFQMAKLSVEVMVLLFGTLTL
eukprot:gene19670-25164_t